MLRVYLILCLSLLTINAMAATEVRPDEVWLLVDTKAKQIEVKKGEETLETLHSIAIGRGGAMRGVGFPMRGVGFPIRGGGGRGGFPLGLARRGFPSRRGHYRNGKFYVPQGFSVYNTLGGMCYYLDENGFPVYFPCNSWVYDLDVSNIP